MSTHLTHFNGRAIATVLQTQARLCVWYVEQDTDGRLSRRPFWGRALDYDPSRGLKVWLDGAQSEAECEWVDEGDDWEWETLEQAANRYGAVQLKLKIGDHPLCVRLPFKRPATGAPPTYASGSADAQSGGSSRPESPYAFAKKAKLLGGVRAAAEHPPPQQAAPHAAGLQAYSAGVRQQAESCFHPPPHPSYRRPDARPTTTPLPARHNNPAHSAQGGGQGIWEAFGRGVGGKGEGAVLRDWPGRLGQCAGLASGLPGNGRGGWENRSAQWLMGWAAAQWAMGRPCARTPRCSWRQLVYSSHVRGVPTAQAPVGLLPYTCHLRSITLTYPES